MTQKATIICVDDEKSILDALKEQLNRYFKREFTIECAENGEKALELFKELIEDKFEVPVIISDHIMPGMKGDELLKQIYQLDPRIKKILLTGQADADAVGRAVNSASLYRYIPKPWEQNDLALTIQEAIRSYYQDRTLEEQNVKLKSINENLISLNLKLEQKVDLFNKFVPNQFLKILKIDLDKTASKTLEDGEDYISLSQCAERELTVMFADIRSFTTICEGLTSSEAFEFVNNYLCELGPVISQHNGFIDKFIGDAIMALFKSADDAVRAGIAMQKQLEVFNKKLEAKGQKPIGIGIGINTDTVMLGTIGEVNRLQTTVIGDAVNLSARTEGKCKEFSTQIVITENTKNKLENPDFFKFRFLDRSKVKGKQQLFNFYEVLNIFKEEQKTKKIEISNLYEKGVFNYHGGALDLAEAIFLECLKEFPEDLPTKKYLSMTQNARHERPHKEHVPEVMTPTSSKYVKFWGTRGSSPVDGEEYSFFGGCTSCLEFRYNDDVIIFDAGSGIRMLGEQLIREKKTTLHLIISHFHWDHLWGFPFFLPIFSSEYTIHIYAPGTIEKIKAQFATLLDPNFFPVGLTDLKANIIFHTLTTEEPLKIGDVTIRCCDAHHPGPTFCFRIETPNSTFGYATDNEFLLGYHGSPVEVSRDSPVLKDFIKQVEFFKGCEIMIHEAQYLPDEYLKKSGWGHSSIQNAVVLMKFVQPKTWILTHHDPSHTDDNLEAKLNIIKDLLPECNLDCQLELASDRYINNVT